MMYLDTQVYLDYEDQCAVAIDLLQNEIRDLLSEDAFEPADYRYVVVDHLLDAHGYFADDQEHFEFVQEIGGDFVNLRQQVLG